MQFSESWLRNLCNPDLSSEALCHLLTMAGLEVEDTQTAAPPFSGVVVAHILTAEKHPDADKLKLCTVDVGTGAPLAIVCGAPNAAPGLKVPCAVVGAVLPGLEIRKAKVRGVESHGMLCSARELGLSQDHDGLLVLPTDAPVGTALRSYLDLDDCLITLKLTPNRADCLSLAGIARELAALTGAPLHLPAVAPVPAALDDARRIVLDAPQACPRYCGRIVRNVNAQAPTPAWMRRRIERSGIRAISALVDITNYVMLELGQPLHAFDNAVLEGAIHVRLPRKGESLTLLNEQTVTPDADTAFIADDAKPLALAGIMGGEHSGIGSETRDLFLESAFFPPDAIAGKARALGFSSDASHRYERGVDFALQRPAIERATALILEICGGTPGPVVEAASPEHLPARRPVDLRPSRANAVLGLNLAASDMRAMLARLGLEVDDAEGRFRVTPPSFRFDIGIEEDLIEEIARVHGYDNIPSPPPSAPMHMMATPEDRRGAMHLRRAVAARGYHEVVTYSFVEAGWEADFAGNSNPVRLANPIASQMGVMRSSLIGGLVGALQTNLRRQASRIRLFELGRCFQRDAAATTSAGFLQPLRIAGIAAGPADPEQWGQPMRRVDFYDVKADVEALFHPRPVRCEPANHPALHPGRSARLIVDGKDVGVVGDLHPRWVQRYELGKGAVAFEITLDALASHLFPAFVEPSRYPFVVRDIALVVAKSQPAQPVVDCLRHAGGPLVQAVEAFDVFTGAGLPDNQKSLAFHIVMQDTQRTLEDAEVDRAMDALLAAAAREFGAALRN